MYFSNTSYLFYNWKIQSHEHRTSLWQLPMSSQRLNGICELILSVKSPRIVLLTSQLCFLLRGSRTISCFLSSPRPQSRAAVQSTWAWVRPILKVASKITMTEVKESAYSRWESTSKSWHSLPFEFLWSLLGPWCVFQRDGGDPLVPKLTSQALFGSLYPLASRTAWI